MSRPLVKAQVHRFHDAAALYVGAGETVYIDAKAARKMARALYAVARSIESEPFAQSQGLTQSFAFADGREKDLPR